MIALCLMMPALAGPAIPQWEGIEVERAQAALPLPTSRLELKPATPPEGATPTIVNFEEEEATGHGWSGQSKLVVAIEGDWNRRYYLEATAWIGDTVYRWQQGAYDGPEETMQEALRIPAEALTQLGQEGAGSVSVRVVETDFYDHVLYVSVAGRAGLSAGGLGLQQVATRTETISLDAWENP